MSEKIDIHLDFKPNNQQRISSKRLTFEDIPAGFDSKKVDEILYELIVELTRKVAVQRLKILLHEQ